MFKFELNAKVLIVVSQEGGEIVGRADYIDGANSYLLRYVSADGKAVEQWWSEGALSQVNEL